MFRSWHYRRHWIEQNKRGHININIMAKIHNLTNNMRTILVPFLLASSIALNLFFVFRSALLYGHHHLGRHSSLRWRPSWSGRAAEEAEYVAAISCSGHGRAYLDGLIISTNHTATVYGKAIATPICECNACFGGSDCSLFLPDCAADADG